MTTFLFFLSVLLMPIWLVMERNSGILNGVEVIESSIGIALLLFSLIHLLRRGRSKAWHNKLIPGVISVLILFAFLIRFLFGFLYDFSGRSFSNEFFAHINMTSVLVSLTEYRNELIALSILSLLVGGLSFKLILRSSYVSLTIARLAMLFALGLIWLGAKASPEWQFMDAYTQYYHRHSETTVKVKELVREESLEVLKVIRPNIELPIEKRHLQASAPAQALNLIMVYLESFNEMFTENPLFPSLTPQIDELKNQYLHYSHIYSSGYVTIEGIANSQCGTLMNMQYANNSLLSRKGRLPYLPCLGDVLHQAGYLQSFLGGASSEFAGKGAFLREHGYDEILGWEHWQPQGHEKVSVWGLSDALLFDQSIDLIKQRHQDDKPFNITLLTIGTHPPGFTFEGCPEYEAGKGDPFLNAIHCTDFLFGRFIDRLKLSGVLENTVLFAQGDHGVFKRRSMRRLFGNSIDDARLFTLLMLPPQVENRFGNLSLDQPGSNIDTVATLLDLLQIKHNTHFILANPHRTEGRKTPYLITRYNDYYHGKEINNTNAVCEPLVTSNSSPKNNLPLDECTKPKAMKAISALNMTYSEPALPDNQVCALGVKIKANKNLDNVEIIWGNQNLSNHFHWRGNKKGAFSSKGIYAVAASETPNGSFNVEQALFFKGNPANEQDQLDGLLHIKSGERQVLFIRTLDLGSLSPEAQKMWPLELTNQSIVYGVVSPSGFEQLLGRETIAHKNLLIPSFCTGGAKWVSPAP